MARAGKVAAAAALALSLLALGCGDDGGALSGGVGGGGSGGVNPNRLPPGAYAQSALSIPGALDDTLYAASAPWSHALSLNYLWSFDDVGAFPLYASLTLPATELIVAIIDTGVDKDHEELAGRLWVNPGEGSDANYANGVDDDGDGFVDDFLGWDFANGTNNPADDAGHGTHVAGTIAAIGANGRGIVGIAPWVRIMALKACNQSGACSSSDIRSAISYAAAHGARVINLSLGAVNTGADSLAFDASIAAATAQGALVFASAGNYASDVVSMTPANATYAMAIAAHRNDGAICSFSNFGFKLDLSAPGCGYDGDSEVAGILSLNSGKCGPAGNQRCATSRTVGDGSYVLKSGTSMSSPHAAGLAAVAFTASPTATPLQIRQALLRTARKTNAGAVNSDFGMGRANASNLIVEAQTAPGVKLVSPRYNTRASSHAISLRIEARGLPVSWTLRYSTNTTAMNVDLSSGTVIASSVNDVGAGDYVTLTQNWTPPAAGDYLVILEAQAGTEKYHDVTVLRR